MPNLITVRRAQEEIKRLQHFVNLAEDYEANTLDKFIIKEYAYTNSIEEITRIFKSSGFKNISIQHYPNPNESFI